MNCHLTHVSGMDHKDFGAGSRTRTDDLLITNQLLYQLSYAGKAWTGERSILAREQAGGISASPAGDFVFERLPTTGTPDSSRHSAAFQGT